MYIDTCEYYISGKRVIINCTLIRFNNLQNMVKHDKFNEYNNYIVIVKL